MKITIVKLLSIIVWGTVFFGCINRTNQGHNHSSKISKHMANDSIINKLINELSSPDVKIAELAITNLVKQGNKAVPILTEKIKDRKTPAKDKIMQALATIGDTSSATLFLTYLKDENARVRAMAAQGLVKVEHSDAIDALIATLHDYGDETSPYTTSAYALIDYGEKALPKVVLLLSDSSFYTRETGYDILAQIVTKIPEYKYKWEELDKQLGSYDPSATEVKREAIALKWRKWVEELRSK